MPAFSPNDPAFLENPFPFYEMGRAFSPLQIGPPGLWSVFGYDDCSAILKDNATWSSFGRRPEQDVEVAPSMLSSDPPVHTRLRGLVSQAFTPRMVEQLEPRIRVLASELLDEAAAAGGTVDLIDALAYPLPVIMIAEILGVPAEDRAKFRYWSDEIVSQLGSGIDGQGGRQLDPGMLTEVGEYFGRMVEERRANPRADLITGLAAAEHEGSKLSFPELMQMLVLLLVAGNETTTNLIGNAVQEFIAYPEQLTLLRERPELLPSAIEEVMRHSSPVQATVRVATRDAEVAGKTIPAGDSAVVWLAAANRDPAVFADPAGFDITRNPNRHIGFGMGIHFCLGAPLARLEARIALETFLARSASFARTDQELLPRVPTFIMRGVRRLPLRVEWREPAAV